MVSVLKWFTDIKGDGYICVKCVTLLPLSAIGTGIFPYCMKGRPLPLVSDIYIGIHTINNTTWQFAGDPTGLALARRTTPR